MTTLGTDQEDHRMTAETVRVCEECGTPLRRIPRPSDGTLTRPSVFAKVRFCSQACSITAQQRAADEAPHGTRTKYRYGCRCDACRLENTLRHREQTQARAGRVARGEVPNDVRHGASTYTNWLCRCDVCTAANVQLARDRRNP